MKILFLLLMHLCLFAAPSVTLTVLGSGGPESTERAGTGYLLQIDGQARLLVDAGSGVMHRFAQSGAHVESLEAIAFTHLHIDHAVDLPAFVKAGYFSRRTTPMPIIGPRGNRDFPAIDEFLETLFGADGAYRYMQDVLTSRSDSFQLIPTVAKPHMRFKTFALDTLYVHHGIVPALAYKITVGAHVIVISGDTNDADRTLGSFAKGADLLIMHHAIPETGFVRARSLHMTPSQIGKIAAEAEAKSVILTHRMKRTLGKEKESLQQIRRFYSGDVQFGEDLMQFNLPQGVVPR